MAPRRSEAHGLGARHAFMRAALLGLATIGASETTPGDLTLPLELSRWMRVAGLGVEGATDALLEVRELLLSVAAFDARSEPVPLLAGDAATALLSLGVYLVGLVDRAAMRGDWTSRQELAQLAADLSDCSVGHDAESDRRLEDPRSAGPGPGRPRPEHPRPRLYLV